MIFLRTLIVIVLQLASFLAFGQLDTVQRIVSNRVNAPNQKSKPYVILISADGLRSDYIKKYQASNLLRLGQQGATAKYMWSSYPTLTFPNHYSLVTGLYPAHHGLVDNTFYDAGKKSMYRMHDTTVNRESSWYGGLPVWVLAEQQQMLTASFYWVGSDVAIQGVRPTYYYNYSNAITVDRRLQIVKEWLQLPEDRRPHLITFYFPQIDDESHRSGPDSPGTAQAVRLIDESIGQLVSITDSLHLEINYIIVSDHGMASVDVDHAIPIPAILRDTAVCSIAIGSTLLHVYVKDKSKIHPLFQELTKQSGDFDVYLHRDIPPAWHYGKKDDRFDRVGDLIIVSRFPKVFKTGNGQVTPGKHGFDPRMEEMHAAFITWGPQIKNAFTIPPFENIHVFPLIAHLLGLTYSMTIDGDPTVLAPILK